MKIEAYHCQHGAVHFRSLDLYAVLITGKNSISSSKSGQIIMHTVYELINHVTNAEQTTKLTFLFKYTGISTPNSNVKWEV